MPECTVLFTVFSATEEVSTTSLLIAQNEETL